MRIVFIGPPGAGKGTQSLRLADHLEVPPISTGDMLRQAIAQGSDLGVEATNYMERGQLVPDHLVEKILFLRLSEPDCAKGCIIDGFPRTVPQAEALDEWLLNWQEPLDVVLEIRVPLAELHSRLAGRGREDDGQGIIAARLRQYDEITRPLLDYYRGRSILHTIEGRGSPNEVFDRILSAVGIA